MTAAPPLLIGATQVAGTGSTGTMPTHIIGDLLVAEVYWNSTGTNPTGWTLILTEALGSVAVSIFVRRATTSSTPHPVFTGSTKVGMQSWRGAATVISHNSAMAASSGATVTYPALALFKVNGSSYVLRFGASSNATNMTTNAPTGHTLVNGLAAGLACFRSTSAATADAATATQAITPATASWGSITAELLSSDTSGGPVVMGSMASATTTVAIPQHDIGDLIIITAARNSNTQASKPVASGTVPAWVDIDAPTGTNTRSIRSAQFVATATNHTSGTWTNATNMTATVVRGQADSPIGGHAVQNNASSTDSTAPTISLSKTDGSSLILAIYASTGQKYDPPPTGYSRLTQQPYLYGGTTPVISSIVNAKSDSTSVSSVVNTIGFGATSSATQIEILSAPLGIDWTADSSLELTANFDADVQRGQNADSSLAVSVGLVSAARRGQYAAASFAATAGFSAIVSNAMLAAASLVATATPSASSGRGQFADASLAAVMTPTDVGRYDAKANANLFVTAVALAAALRSVNASASLGVTAITSTDGTALPAIQGSLSVLAGLLAAAVRGAQGDAALAATAGFLAAASRGQSLNASLAAAASASASVAVNRRLDANLVINANMTASARRGVNAGASFAATVGTNVLSTDGSTMQASLPVTVGLTAAGSVNRAIGASLAVEAVTNGTIGALLTAEADLAVVVSAWVRFDSVREIVYVLWDNRWVAVALSERAAEVAHDERLVDVGPEVRGAAVDSESRSVKIARELRTAGVPAEDRSISIPPEITDVSV